MIDKLIKILIVELIIIILLVVAISFNSFPVIDTIKDTIKNFDYVDDYISNSDNDKNNYEESKTNENEYLFETIRNGLLEGHESINIPRELLNDNVDNFFDIVKEVILDTPEILYYSGGKYSNSIFLPKYSKSVEEKQNHQKIIRSKRDKIISQKINSNMSEYEIVKTIHDYIVNNTRYDTRHFSIGKVPDESYNVYGVLIEGIAVCEGYAKTMKYLLDKAGIENYIVLGTANGENHAWNIVNIEEDYYHVDVTWDDPVSEDGSDILIYDYFNLKDEDIGKTHSWNRNEYPKCNSDKYNYYNFNELIVYNYEELYNKIFWALVDNKEEITFKIIDFNEETYDIPSIINKIAINNPNIINASKYSYSVNAFQGIIRICFIK